MKTIFTEDFQGAETGEKFYRKGDEVPRPIAERMLADGRATLAREVETVEHGKEWQIINAPLDDDSLQSDTTIENGEEKSAPNLVETHSDVTATVNTPVVPDSDFDKAKALHGPDYTEKKRKRH